MKKNEEELFLIDQIQKSNTEKKKPHGSTEEKKDRIIFHILFYVNIHGNI